MKLFVKTWCPWCVDAVSWLKARGHVFDLIDVEADAAAYAEMIRISGQRKTPTLELTNGQVLPDFDVRQLERFLHANNIPPG